MPPVIVDPARVHTFENEAAFERWLSENHDSEPFVWIKIHKKSSGLATISPTEAIDVALCWGWIDAIRKGFDETSFLQRYTPRGKKSVWSQINRDNVARLEEAGRMTEHGRRQVEAAKLDGRWEAAYAPMSATSAESMPEDLRSAIAANPRAEENFRTLNRASLFALAFRTSNMKTPAGRAKKVAELVEMLARGETILPSGASAAPNADAPKAKKKRGSVG